MTKVTLRPDGTISSAGMGDATPHVELSDSSTGTTESALGSSAAMATMTLGTTTLPAGAVTKSLTALTQARGIGTTLPGRAHVKVTKADGTVLVDYIDAGFASTSFVTRSSSAVKVALSQADVDGLRLWVHLNEKQAGPYPVVMAEAYADLRYVTVPTIALDAAVTSLDTVTQSWTYSQPDVDGGAQAQWVARVFTAAQYGASGWDPATSTATAEASGTGSTAAVTLSGLPDGSNHRIYVRAADDVNGVPLWSAWQFNTFTITTTRAQVLTVTPTAQPSTASVSVAVARNTGNDAWTGVEVERLSGRDVLSTISAMEGAPSGGVAGGWFGGALAGAPTGVTWSTPTVAGHGQVQRVVLTTATASSVSVQPFPFTAVPVQGGDTVQIFADFNSSAWNNNAPAFAMFMNTAAGFAGWQWLPIIDRTTGWRRYTAELVVPSGVVSVTPFVGVGDVGGTSVSTTVDIDNVNAFINGTWVPVVGSRFAASGDSLTITDRLVAGDRSHTWRARAANAAGSLGSWVLSPLATVTPTRAYLRDATNPTNEWSVQGWQVDGFPADGREVPTATLDVIGRADPVTVYDVPKYGAGQFRVECETLADSDALVALLDGRTLMILQPAVTGPSMLIHPTKWVRERGEGQIATELRYITVDYQQVG